MAVPPFRRTPGLRSVGWALRLLFLLLLAAGVALLWVTPVFLLTLAGARQTPGLAPVLSVPWLGKVAGAALLALAAGLAPAAWNPARHRVAVPLALGLSAAALVVLGAPWWLVPVPLAALALWLRARARGEGADFRPWTRADSLGVALAALVVAVATAGFVWPQFFRRHPYAAPADDTEFFLRGSVAAPSLSGGLPLYLWEVLPEVFADLLPQPGGWEAFGFLYARPDDAVPVGLVARTNGFPALSVNCAACHTGSYRRAPDEPRELLPAAPATRLDFDAWLRFLGACGNDPRFDAATLLPAIERRHALTPAERLAYAQVIIPAARVAFAALAADFAWAEARTPSGPGRQDATNFLKFMLLRLAEDGTSGLTDFQPVWHQAARTNLHGHWNAAAPDVRTANWLAAAFLLDFTPVELDRAAMDRLERWLANVPPPPFPGPVDAPLAERGRALYGRHCAECHAPGGARLGEVVPYAEAGTDATYVAATTPAAVTALRDMGEAPFRFTGYRRTDGFQNLLLDGVWARAPYLHNGSVPTLWDLLLPPAGRPRVFHRGHDVVDPRHVGFVSAGPDAEREGTRFDTALAGNGNGGHAYGTELPEADRWALVEFLKTL